VGLPQLRETPGLEGMELLERGSRHSVRRVSVAEWKRVLKLGGL